jgi:CRP/FNR family nitrogen fixation transcriptional regulator
MNAITPIRTRPGGPAVAATFLDTAPTQAGGGGPIAFAPGEAIYWEGDPAEHWYVVVSGAVRACKLTPDGRRQIIEFHLPGDAFGLDGADAVHVLTAEAAAAEEPTVVMRHCRRRLYARAATDPHCACWLRDIALFDLARAQNRLLLLGCQDASERVAGFLLEMADRQPAMPTDAGVSEFHLPMSRGDIADYLGLSLETVSRTFQALRRNNAIALPSPRSVRILDDRALADLAGCSNGDDLLPRRANDTPARRLAA